MLEQHAAALRLYARQLCDTPDDVVQEALVRLAGQPTCPDDVVAWLYRVVRNGALTAARSQRRRRKHETEAAAVHANWFEASADDALDAETVASVLAELAAEDREIVVARIWSGLTFRQIGELIGASDSAAHRRYEKALAELRVRLQSCMKSQLPESLPRSRPH